MEVVVSLRAARTSYLSMPGTARGRTRVSVHMRSGRFARWRPASALAFSRLPAVSGATTAGQRSPASGSMSAPRTRPRAEVLNWVRAR
jgi:hypothetical protein